MAKLPWDHLNVKSGRNFLEKEQQRSVIQLDAMAEAKMTAPVEVGLDRCIQAPPQILLDGAKFGLLMNQASVTAKYQYACDVLADRFPRQIVALFSPQHGLWCEQQANMIESAHTQHQRLGIPVHSLYSKSREPTSEMLRGLDAFVIDLQDVGTRVYTFIWTIVNCLRTCQSHSIPVLILDRPTQ